MLYIKDWEATKKRFSAFWEHEILDRCCISIKAPNPVSTSSIPIIEPKDRKQFWTDPECIISANRRKMENTYYAGDAFPQITLNLGAAGHAGFFKNANPFYGDSIWFLPSIDPEDIDSLIFDESAELYRHTISVAKALAEDSRGDYIISMPDTSGNIDALAHLIGSENVMMGLYDDPDAIKSALAKMQSAYERITTETHSILKDVNDGGGCIGWLDTWAPGFHAQMQCDMSVMLSNDMFREFILPELQAQAKHLEYPLYHFDGIEQLRHLDDLLSIPELRAIQWTQVSGQPSCLEFIPELQRIQKAGKNLVMITYPNQIRPLLENLSSKGLYLIVEAPDKDTADAVLKEVTVLTHE